MKDINQGNGAEMQKRFAAIPKDRQHYVECLMSGGAIMGEGEGEPLVVMEVILHDLIDDTGSRAARDPAAPRSVLSFGLSDMKVIKRTLERLETEMAKRN